MMVTYEHSVKDTILMSLLILLGTSSIPAMMSGAAYNSNAAFATSTTASHQQNLPVDWALQQSISEQLRSHRGDWVGMTECDQNNCHMVYLGPKHSNPYSHGVNTLPPKPAKTTMDSTLAGPTTVLTLPSQNAAAQIQPTSYPDGGANTTPAEIVQTFTAKASSNNNVDFLMNLNAWTGSDTHWIQASLFYDKADLTGTGVTWYAEMDSHDDEGNDDFAGDPPVLAVTTNSQTDGFAERLYALGDVDPTNDLGCYEASISDTSNGHAYSFSECYSDDNDNNMLLTSEIVSTGQYADSGSMSEDIATDSTSVYYWGSEQYNLGFYNDVYGTEYTSVNAWTSNNGSDGDLSAVSCSDSTHFHITPGLSPAQDTMVYNSC